MHRSLRPSSIAVALVAIGGFAAAVDGCVTKPPPPDPTPPATSAPKPESTQSSDAATSARKGTSPHGTGSTDGGAGAGGASAGPGTSSAGPGTASGGSGSSAAGPGTASGGGGASSAGTGRESGGSGSLPAGAGTASGGGHPQTSDERRAALDKRLNDSLGAFDARLRKEQERIARERDARQTAVTTVAAVDGGTKPASDENGEAAENTGDAPQKAASSRRGASGSRSARGGDLKSDKSAGGANGNASGNGAVAQEVPDGNDDDIVARRLRKAAEQETDPELKDKLWKEYVEYKKNTQGK